MFVYVQWTDFNGIVSNDLFTSSLFNMFSWSVILIIAGDICSIQFDFIGFYSSLQIFRCLLSLDWEDKFLLS